VLFRSALQCPDNVCAAPELITMLSTLRGAIGAWHLGSWRQGGDTYDWPKRRERMSLDVHFINPVPVGFRRDKG